VLPHGARPARRSLSPSVRIRGEDRMTKTSRRGFIGALALSSAAFGASRVGAMPARIGMSDLKKETDIACVYHCDFGDPQRFSQMLTNMNNHLSVYEFDPMRVKLVVVAHGAGIKFFLADRSGTAWERDAIDEDLYKRFVGLAKFGVEGYLCEITYKRQKIDFAKTRDDPFLKFVPSGVATVAELQSKGFAYLKVG
jgi:intracellular sulfur oxidation DsrE/DsrF family protein